ncbi:MAG: hypothetical protein M3N08_05520 [Pseudomonadota bacterium]|nr:hypothetical protein [Pseudomonadota bacterium]
MAVVPPPATVGPTTPGGPSSLPGPNSANLALPPVAVSIQAAPDKILQLAHQIQVPGLIAGTPNAATVTVSTLVGNLTLLLPALVEAEQKKLLEQLLGLFEAQKTLTVVVQPGNPPSQAFLLVPPLGSASALTPPAAPLASLSALPTAGAQDVPKTWPTLSPTSDPTGLAPPVTLVRGSLIAVLVLQSLPATIATQLLEETALAAQGHNNLYGGTRPGRTEVQASQPVGGGSPTIGPFEPGVELTLHIEDVAMPSSRVPIAPAANQFLAVVTGVGANGQLLLKAGDGTFYVRQTVLNAPIGTTLLVTADIVRPPLPLPLEQPDAGGFASLQEALTALAQLDPNLARQVIENFVPQANAALPGALLFLLSAFKQGDTVRGWLGADMVETLAKAGKMELVTHLGQQLAGETGLPVQDPVVGAWRSYPLPLYVNGQFETLRLYVHGDGQKNAQAQTESKTGGKPTRFLIDVRMSKLGPLQLDGFVRAKQLDMMVRSEKALPEGLNENLRQTYISTLAAVGFAGSLAFQIGRQHWLRIQSPGAAGSVLT